MSKQCRLHLLLAILFSLSLAAVAGEKPPAPKPIRSIGELNGKRLGVIIGTILDAAANSALDLTQIHYFEDTEEELKALLAGEIDAVIDDQPIVRHLANADPRIRQLPGVLIEDSYGFAMRQNNDELYREVNNALRALLADGTMRDMERRWLDSPDDSTRVMPELPEQTADRILRFGASPVSPPFVYTGANGKLTGMDIEIMERIARRINRRLVVESMDFGELFFSLQDGRVDVIGACLSITPERREIARFTDSYYHGGVAALVLEFEEK